MTTKSDPGSEQAGSERFLIELLDYVKGNGERPPSLWMVEEKLTEYLRTQDARKVEPSALEKLAKIIRARLEAIAASMRKKNNGWYSVLLMEADAVEKVILDFIPQPALTKEEQAAVKELGEIQGLSEIQVIRCALRDYQMRVKGAPDFGPKLDPALSFTPSPQIPVPPVRAQSDEEIARSFVGKLLCYGNMDWEHNTRVILSAIEKAKHGN